MTFQTPHTMSSLQRLNHIFAPRGRKLATRLGSGLLALSLSIGMALPAVAADPFRANTAVAPHDIGPLTESAFKAIFKDGDYESAREYISQAQATESDEPLIHAMTASMSYLDNDLAGVYDSAIATQTTAEALKATDPLRGHLYSAVGVFLEGAHVMKTQGVGRGTPTALGMLQKVFNELDEAESIDPNDPELNLIKGYMDLMLAVNLPFSNPAESIDRVNAYGSPVYLAQRGIAIGYRDLENLDAAIVAVDQAIAAAPTNPELFYLKAQLLAKQGAQADSAVLFDKALDYSDQLPTSLVKQITWEGCVAEGIATDEQCKAQRDAAVGAF